MVLKLEQSTTYIPANPGNETLQENSKSAHDANARDTVASESGAGYDWMGHFLPFGVCEW